MAYRGFIEEIPDNLLKTLRGALDFHGRSTRTEAVTFLIVPQIVAGIAVAPLIFLPETFVHFLSIALKVILIVPLVALIARRLHDQNRSAWWLISLAPLPLLASYDAWRMNRALSAGSFVATPLWLTLSGVAFVIFAWVITLWPNTDGPNRFGPDPKWEEPAEQEVVESQ